MIKIFAKIMQRKLNSYIYKYWKSQALIILLGLIILPLGLLNPYLTKLVIDKAYVSRDAKLFVIFSIAIAAIFIVSSLINSLNEYLLKRLNRRVNYEISRDVFRRLQSFSISFFNTKSTGEHLYKLSSDVRTVSDFVCNVTPQIAALLPRFFFILIIVFYLNWKIAIFMLLAAPVSCIHPYLFAKWLKDSARRMVEASQAFFKGLGELFSHILLVKAFGREKQEIKKFEEALANKTESELKLVKTSSVSSFSGAVLNKSMSGLVVLYGGYQVVKGEMTLGSLTAIMIYLAQLTGIFRSIGSLYENSIIASVSRQRLLEILDAKPKIEDVKDAVDFSILKGAIEFKGVSFGYEKETPLFKNINFSIPPGSKIAIAGESGCGKTTLLNLILRLYDTGSGVISIGGVDIKNIKLVLLREQIGIALQESFLWNATVKENILYGKEDADKNDMFEAVRVAEADTFILRLPGQYNSAIGEMACRISEGQKQRISIARAVIKKPKILILDEAMSSLDSETEAKIIDNIKDYLADSTIIIVSHRLSAIKKMDMVYFLESHSKMEIARHEELAEKNSKYGELFANQAL